MKDARCYFWVIDAWETGRHMRWLVICCTMRDFGNQRGLR